MLRFSNNLLLERSLFFWSFWNLLLVASLHLLAA
jgi:hypothetical protein